MVGFKTIGAAAALFAASVSAIPQYTNLTCDTTAQQSKTLYFLQSDPAGASIVSLDISSGQAENPVRIETGGLGSGVFNNTNNTIVNIDPLNSQGSVDLDGDFLFTVNAGSNSISMFKIDPTDPQHPALVGEPTDSQGDFPLSITYSDVMKTVCVLNGGTRNNVACFKNNGDSLTLLAPPLSLGLDYLTNPPLVNNGTLSQIQFSPFLDGLLITGRNAFPGVNNTNNAPGYMWALQFENGVPLDHLDFAQIPDMIMPFGFSFIGNDSSSFFLTDPDFGGSLVDLNAPYFNPTEVKHTKQDTVATCWAIYSYETGYGYFIDGFSPKFTQIDPDNGEVVETFVTDASLPGTFDTIVDGATAWYISWASTVGAYDLKNRQVLEKKAFGPDVTGSTGQWWNGMAIYKTCKA